MIDDSEFVFAPLGGLGEIGMNCALYGYGPVRSRKWLMVDLGLAFAGEDLPGIDLIMPDLAFIEKVKKDLVGLVITHAHEDHIGSLAELWPRLGVPVYMTRFAAGLAEARRLGEPGAPKIPIRIVAQDGRIDIGPFDVEFIAVAHSIPESCALAIRTPAGLVVHSGDWKIDATPLVGRLTDEARLRASGEEGVLAFVCDSTNVLREGESPSEADVAKSLTELVSEAKGRVIVTTFASNVARLRVAAGAPDLEHRAHIAQHRGPHVRQREVVSAAPEDMRAAFDRGRPEDALPVVQLGLGRRDVLETQGLPGAHQPAAARSGWSGRMFLIRARSAASEARGCARLAR